MERIRVRAAPYGLAISADQRYLYVCNSRAPFISVIDLERLEVVDEIPTPGLGPFDGYTPGDIAVVSDALALFGTIPPGAASPGPIHELDLRTRAIRQRLDLNPVGISALFRTTPDRSTTAIMLGPGYSPTRVMRYDSTTDTGAVTKEFGIQGNIAISPDGTQMAIGNIGGYVGPSVILTDRDLNTLGRVRTVDAWYARGLAYDASTSRYLYVTNDHSQTAGMSVPPHPGIAEVDTTTRLQTRELSTDLSGHRTEGYEHASYSLVLTKSGWAYAVMNQVNAKTAPKLVALEVGASTPPDSPTHKTYLPLVLR